MHTVCSIVFGLLLSYGAQAASKAIDQMGRAIGMGDKKLFEQTLPQLKNIDETLNQVGETPLTLAAFNGQHEMVKVLLKRGANVNHQTQTGYSALIFAAMVTHKNVENAVKTARLLLDAGADKSLRNADGETAYDMAVKGKHKELIAILR